MKKIIKYILILCSAVVFSQNTTVSYKLKNPCNNMSMSMAIGIDPKYFKKHSLFFTAEKEHFTSGKFDIGTDHAFPLPYSFSCTTDDNGFKVTSMFIVGKENLQFELDSITNSFQPLPVNNKNSSLVKDQYRFYSVFSKWSGAFFSKEDKEANIKLNKLLIQYSKQNPDSYMLFWTLVGQFQMKNSNEAYFQAFRNLSPKIRNSEYGKMLYHDMINSLKLSEQNQFPDFEFQDKKILSALGKKYTLVDFWFSHCQPCLDKIPFYKKLYSEYKDKGFEILNISTDRTEEIWKWEKVIKEKELNWAQYLDENGTKSKFYNIQGFPTTFLLDSDGIIIKKNISDQELELFLKENLK